MEVLMGATVGAGRVRSVSPTCPVGGPTVAVAFRAARTPLYQFRYNDVTVTVIDESLLDGAHRAIERWGWREATLERIATEAGVSRMTLHRRGVTRDGLLGALAERLEDSYRAGM